MRADGPANCAPLAPRGGGSSLQSKKKTTQESNECKTETKNVHPQTPREIEEEKKESGNGLEKTGLFYYQKSGTKKRAKLIDSMENLVSGTQHLSYVQINTAELSECQEPLSYSQYNRPLCNLPSSNNHNNCYDAKRLVTQSNETILHADDTNCNNDRISGDYATLSNNSTSESESKLNKPTPGINGSVETTDCIVKRISENPSTSQQSSYGVESRSSCESIQDIESDGENNVVSNASNSSGNKYNTCGRGSNHLSIMKTESKNELLGKEDPNRWVNGKISENESLYSVVDNSNHYQNYGATHAVESDNAAVRGFTDGKNGNAASSTNKGRPSDTAANNIYRLSSIGQLEGRDEIISVDVINKKIFTVSELLDRGGRHEGAGVWGSGRASLGQHPHRGVPKSQSCNEYSSVVLRDNTSTNTRPVSLAGRRVAVRHRDAEEALSSLLWQPYECREEAGEWCDAASGAGAAAHSLLGARYGETCAADMRLTVPAPAFCRAVQPAATCAEPKQVALNNGEPKQGENSVNANNDVVASASVSVNINDSINVVNDNRVSVNGEVMGCEVVSGGVVRDVEAPRRSWTSCGAQTEEAPTQAPPPYSTLPPPHAHHPLPVALPLQPHGYPFQPVTLRRCQYGEDSEPPKTCCGAIGTRTIGLKWFIVLVALAGICCVLVGTVLGAVRAQGKAHLTVLLLMIGVGLVLVTVSGVAWRAISKRRSRNAASRAASSPTGTTRRGASGTSCMRAHHPYAAMLYPEFHCRPPPPSYQASMHEYRLRLLLLDRAASPPPVACPPPPYRPRPRGMAGAPGPYMGRGARGRRRQEARTTTTPLSAVVIQNIALEPYGDIKYEDVQEMDPPIVSDSKVEEVQDNKEGNLVTIVQTGEDTSPVIVTVSGSMPEERTNQTTTEIDILAHL